MNNTQVYVLCGVKVRGPVPLFLLATVITILKACTHTVTKTTREEKEREIEREKKRETILASTHAHNCAGVNRQQFVKFTKKGGKKTIQQQHPHMIRNTCQAGARLAPCVCFSGGGGRGREEGHIIKGLTLRARCRFVLSVGQLHVRTQ